MNIFKLLKLLKMKREAEKAKRMEGVIIDVDYTPVVDKMEEYVNDIERLRSKAKADYEKARTRMEVLRSRL